MIVAERVTDKTVKLSTNGQITSVPSEKVSKDVKEGDVVILGKDGIYVKDAIHTEKRSGLIRDLFDKIKRGDK